MDLLRTLANLNFLSEPRRMELYPPFFLMRAKIVEMRDEWRFIRIRLPLTFFSKNLGGAMFGGWQAALADPVAAMSCARVFRDYSVWTRAMSIDFQAPGNTDLELRFEMPAGKEAAIRAELRKEGRATPVFEYGLYRTDGVLCTHVVNTVAIRPKGYAKPSGGLSRSL
ncbi:MAG TPA: PaaI family thioesterase [Gammaproteobacteria bacterium]|nr:PaaI family thioesterase [Gammaproteobacteria bacterium]